MRLNFTTLDYEKLNIWENVRLMKMCKNQYLRYGYVNSQAQLEL